MKLGISPLSWTNEAIQELGDHIPYETCISEAARAGFTGVELGRKFPSNPEVVLSSLAEKGLVPVTGWYSGELAERSLEDEWEAAQPAIERLKALGCTLLVYGECAAGPADGADAALATSPPLTNLDVPVYAERVTQFADNLAELGLTLVYHHHMMQPVETVGEIDRFMSEAGASVKLLLDTGHIALSGEDYTKVMNKWWDQISHIHLKDIRRDVFDNLDPSTETFNDAVHKGIYTVPGDGDLDFEPVIKKIASEGYSGWLIVEAEQDPRKAQPSEVATTAFTYLAALLDKHGIPYDRNSAHG